MTKALIVTVLAAVSMKAETLQAKITFPFVVSGVSIPAGEYRIGPVGPVHDQRPGKWQESDFEWVWGGGEREPGAGGTASGIHLHGEQMRAFAGLV